MLVRHAGEPAPATAAGTARYSAALRRSILSWLAGWFGDLLQDGIDGVSCFPQFHSYGDDRQGGEGGKIAAQVHCVFFGGDEAARLGAPLQPTQFMDVR